MSTHENSIKIGDKIIKQFKEATGVDFYLGNLSYSSNDCVIISDVDGYSPDATQLQFKYMLTNENDIDSAVISLDYMAHMSSNRTFKEAKAILNTLKAITNTDLELRLHFSEYVVDDKHPFMNMITISKHGCNGLINDIPATDELLNALYEAYTKNALSIVCVRQLKELDKKYVDFLKSRGAINLNGDWWAILDND